MAAYRTLSHADLLELIGSRRSDRRSELLDRAARTLSEPDQAFWAPRRAAVIRHGLGGAGRFERYFRQFRLGLLPLVHDRRTVQALLEPRSPEQRARFWTQRWNSRRWRFLVDTFFSKTVMGRLGRDPSFFDHAEGSAARQVQAKTHQALVEQDPSQNPYLFWILNGRHGEVLPRALRPERFDLIRERLDRLELHEVPIEALAEAGVRAHAFNLSDIFEYMGPDAHGHAYATVLDAAAPGARIAYWNMMAPRSAPAPHQGRVRRDAGLEAQLKPLDKAFFYRDFVIEAVT
jgi:S-adenosylmethionine-diacylglycerol 3-amino-3-carboxypropyl transferase